MNRFAKFCAAFILLSTLTIFKQTVYAQEEFLNHTGNASGSNDIVQPEQFQEPIQESLIGIILEILEEESQEVYGKTQKLVTYKVRITHGSKRGEEVEIAAITDDEAEVSSFDPGDKVTIIFTQDLSGQDTFYITDYYRINSLIILTLAFIILVIIINKKWGLSTLIGLVYSFAIIFKFILPKISQGANPVIIAIAGTFIIAPVIFYLSHGLNRKTTIALVSTLASLIFTGILATAFIGLTKLTGFGSEDALFLQYANGGLINIKGLLLAGIIVGSLGILENVTTAQVAAVFQLKKTNIKLDPTETFHMAMNAGHDRISSAVNTLVLVYTGATLPLLLLFINNPVSASEVINTEIIAEEIVRTLVGSIGLVLAVPITTLLATFYYQGSPNVKKKKN